MKLLAEISEASLGIGEAEQPHSKYELRKSARALLRDKAGNIALQYLQTRGFHKLPGGGLEKGEQLEDALRREIQEEVGCALEIDSDIGVVIEYRNMFGLLILSYCYIADITGEIGETNLDTEEAEAGTTTMWVSPQEALEKIKQDEPNEKKAHFILKREMTFLEAYLEQYQDNQKLRS